MGRALAIALLTAAVVAPGLARARSAPRPVGVRKVKRTPAEQKRLEQAAKLRYQRGTRAYKAGNYRAALRLYQAAASLVWRPSLAYNIALCHDKLKEFGKAIIALRQYLASKPPEAWARRTRAWIRILLGQATVRVQITSYPSGAAIYIDGKSKGLRGRTPAFLKLKPGRYQMQVEASGHEPSRRQIVVDVGGTDFFDFQLKRRSALKVATSVAGARVSIDDEKPSLAPVRRVVRPGRHRIEVSREGYYTVSRVVVIQPGEQASVFVDLRPRPRYGYLRVKCNQTGATVQVESESVGDTPLGRYRLRVGTYRVYVKKPNFQTWERRVTIVSKQVTVLDVRLSPRRSRRQLAWFIAGTVVTGLALSTSVIMTLTAINAKNEYDDLPRASTRAAGRQFALSADVLLATGIVTGAITAFLTWRLKPSASRGEVQVVPMLGPGFAGMTAGGRF